jgi:hypothetical protein
MSPRQEKLLQYGLEASWIICAVALGVALSVMFFVPGGQLFTLALGDAILATLIAIPAIWAANDIRRLQTIPLI